MRGLWMKDFLAIKKSAKIFLIFMGVAVFNGYTSGSPTSVFLFMTVFFVSFAPSTIFYDQKNHGMTYIFTLPIRKSTYIIQKQLLTFAICMASVVVSILLVLGVLQFLVEGFSISNESILLQSMLSLLIGCTYGALAIPIFLKFGSEHAQEAMFGVIAIFVGGGFLIEGLGIMQSSLVLNITQALTSLSAIQLSVGVLAITAAMLAISTVVSQRFIQIAD